MIKERRFISIVLSALTALMLCGPFTLAEEAGDGMGDAAGADISADIAAEATSEATAEMSADVTIGYVAPSMSKLNPFLCNEHDMVNINSLVYESLFELDSNLQPKAVLAENWSVDGKTWTINVRSGISFHNGVELVAQDVVSSYEFFKNTTDNPYSQRLELIESIVASDTFTITVKGKYQGMITLYALVFPVVQRDTASSAMPMGTGPYWYISYVEDQYIRLEANPLWWKVQPNVQSIVFRHYWDVGQCLEALQTGEIDMFQTRSTSAALTKKLSYVTALDYTTSTYEMLSPNLSGIMGDLNLRKAVMYAIDYNTLLTNVYLDMAQQSEVPIYPGSWLYETRSAVYYYSPERAMQYLNDAGWADLTGDTLLNKVENNVLKYLDVKIITYDDSTSNVRSNAAGQIAANLRAVGLPANAQTLTRSKFIEKLESGDYDLALMGVNLSEVPDLVPMFSEGGDVNFSGVHSQELNDLLKATVSAADETAMKNAYSDIQTYIVENLPVMGLCFRTGMVLSTRSLAGFTGTRQTDTFSGMEFLEN